MKVMVIGGGGREHAIIKALKKSPLIDELFAVPGNGGIAADARCADISPKDIDAIVRFAAEEGIDYAVVAPDDPLVLGAVDALSAAGIPCFGPDKKAAVIEGSKVFSKALMKKYKIPTADYMSFSDMDEALAYARGITPPIVVKADGLALGKGVVIAETTQQAEQAIIEMMQDKKFGDSGLNIVIEEYLTGPEVSVLAFTDGKTLIPMVSSMDHKRALDGDRGLNTGGMGTIAPNPYYTPQIAQRCYDEIFIPTMNAMNAEGRTFKGCLYFGLMLTAGGPKVIEYNCRFGDPETQVVLPLLQSDLFEIMRAVTDQRLADVPVSFSDGAACCVIMASDGYPAGYKKGFEITIPEGLDSEVYVAGAGKDASGRLITSGGRVLGVSAVADTLGQAIEKAYADVGKISFENAYYRRDIGKRALEAPGKVHRVYVEKKPELSAEAEALKNDIRSFLRIEALTELRIINRYDVEGIDRELFDKCVKTVFSEPQTDTVSYDLDSTGEGKVIAVEYLPGQFDQRADSAAQCIQIISQQDRPAVRSARIYVLYGDLTPEELEKTEKYLINPVESRRASTDEFTTLAQTYPEPDKVAVLDGFRDMGPEEIDDTIAKFGLAMDSGDLLTCRDYFRREGRDPTVTELKMLDTYWSDHCRHTTFNTVIDSVDFSEEILRGAYDKYLDIRKELGRTSPQCLMDIGTIAARKLKAEGRLTGLDESDEINACTVKIKVDVDGSEEDWLLLFKNETHNHPTEIEPFGGAATCIGGAIRDPLSGRGYVYAAMRLTGAADPLVSVSETLPGKLPQRKIVTTAAAGYSSYGNQIGLATGMVDELYHSGYAAKRMEIGAVLGAVKAENVRRETPVPGDVVILLGGRTGRDGIGGATGSSKSHTVSSLEQCGAEVQKGNAPEERKLQRLFRDPEAARLIKRCNDFGAGGVSVAVGELADGLEIELDKVTKKYEGLDGTELAISESQERMAVVVSADDAQSFCRLADKENLEATVIARVTKEPRLVMYWRGDRIVDISREFLNSNGAEKHISITAPKPEKFSRSFDADFKSAYIALADDLNVCSKRGLSERFDSTIGAGTVMMPFGGKNQLTPIQAMVHKIPVENGHTDSCSFMSWGYNPYISEKSPYHGAYLAVIESVSKLAAAGASMDGVYLSFQEYFEKLGHDSQRWGKPFAALLGALRAQTELGIAAIGGKDSMSGSFEKLDVPPTLVSFAVSTGKTERAVSPEFKRPGSAVIWLRPQYDEWGIPDTDSFKEVLATLKELIDSGRALSVYTPAFGGVAEGVMKMCFGNGLGFVFSGDLSEEELFGYSYGSFIVELDGSADAATPLGFTADSAEISYRETNIGLDELLDVYENKLETVFPCNIAQKGRAKAASEFHASEWPSPSEHFARPRVLIPVFPGTNCEYDTAKAFADAGAAPEIFVINNLTAASIKESVLRFASALDNSQILFIPGGFSAGDEPDGSGKFIAAFLRSGAVSEALTELLDKRMGLACGICNGFQALIKLGLVPFGRIIDADDSCPTLTYNTIGRHQSRIVSTRVISNKSPWLMNAEVGEVYSVAISHGEGRFIADEKLISQLNKNGQIITRYADPSGHASMDVRFNPNNSDFAVEGICSPDGRVMGKMGHCERSGGGLYKNVKGNYDIGMFRSAVEYYK